jgi:hypothetical protein
MNIQYIDQSHCQDEGCVKMYTEANWGGKLHVFGIGDYDCDEFSELRLHD